MNHREVMQQALDALEWVNDNTADEMPIVDAALFDLRGELAKPAAVPDHLDLGETIFTPKGKEVRFCYTRGQPDNVNAWRLGEACDRAAAASAGDPIDRGLGLLKKLEEEGYGVFRFATTPPAPAVSPVDVEAVRERIESLEYAEKWLGLFFKEAWSAAQAGKIGRHRESLSTLRLELARAIGDEK